jgi:hypothetical protein
MRSYRRDWRNLGRQSFRDMGQLFQNTDFRVDRVICAWSQAGCSVDLHLCGIKSERLWLYGDKILCGRGGGNSGTWNIHISERLVLYSAMLSSALNSNRL